MLRISEEEYRSLELKIQEEVQKVFTRFLEDLERKKTESFETLTTGELPEPDLPTGHNPVKPVTAPAKPHKRRTPKKSIEMIKKLQTSPQTRPKSSDRILKEDMDKIFGKKYRK